MLYEYGKRTPDFFEEFIFFLKFSLFCFWGAFNKTIIPLALVGYDMSQLGAMLSYLKTGSLDNAIREFSLA